MQYQYTLDFSTGLIRQLKGFLDIYESNSISNEVLKIWLYDTFLIYIKSIFCIALFCFKILQVNYKVSKITVMEIPEYQLRQQKQAL